MKMNSQSRTFVKQVQVDLLALGDADLLQLVHHWMDERSAPNEPDVSFEVPEETRLALGYRYIITDIEAASEAENAEVAQWHAPSPEHLRALLTAMDANQFSKHVITLAFQSLHPLYPEWYEGLTFNAHLANYLRRIRQDAENS